VTAVIALVALMVAVASSGFATTVGKAAVAAPAAPSWNVLVTDWSLDVAFPFVVALGAAYVIGVRRLHARGRSWPASRTAAFLSGLVVVLVATESGLAAYDRVLYSLHVVQHVLLGMVAPLLLVLGAPITLALQAGSRTS
jgi:cytochrome c oxidase assembly factor CtaG